MIEHAKYERRTPCNTVWFRTLAAALLLTTANTQAANQSCFEMAHTPMEQAYCKIKASGHGKSLPNLQDFRNNPENMQRLLLKSPARKARIALPEASAAPPPAAAAPKSTASSTSKTEANPKAPQSAATADGASGIARCILLKNQIQCGSDYYLLRTNLPNHELGPEALSISNKLQFPNEQSAQYRKATALQYLSDCYPIYIEKMLTIGLGDSTMSFTRFAAMHEEIQKNGADFSQRFSEMFELLKTEKTSNAIRRRYNNNFPSQIEQCMFLSGRTIVCDNVATNWVYQR